MAAFVGASVDMSVLDIVGPVSSSLGVGCGVDSVNVPAIGGKELVDLLEVSSLGLGKHEVNDGHPAGIEDGKDDIGLPLDVLKG